MKILLTGQPGIGKSTIIKKVSQSISRPLYGVIAHEIRNKSNERIGFEAQNFQNKMVTFAHKTKIKSDHLIGGKYYVDLDAIDKFIVPELEKGLKEKYSLTIIDEIGRMQSISNVFIKTIQNFFKSEASFLGTIVLDPEPWSLEFKNHDSVILIEVTKENREDITNSLSIIFSSIDDYYKLNKNQRQFIKELLRKYFSKSEFIQINKLFNNAIGYVTNDKVKIISNKNNILNYELIGKTNRHNLSFKKPNTYKCDCDLFNGRSLYKNNKGECSHIQSIKILKH